MGRGNILNGVSKRQRKALLTFEKENDCALVGCMESDEEFHFLTSDNKSLFLFSIKLQQKLRR